MTTDTGQVPVPASVLSLRMRGAADGLRAAPDARERLLAIARKALAGWPRDCRVVLEAPDGLAFVGDVAPSVALRAAGIAAREAGSIDLGIALHHGLVQVLRSGGATRVTGEGLETASVLAGFTGTRGIVASQSFRDRIAKAAPHAAEDLRAAGEMVDEQLRKHPIFVFDADAARGRSVRRNVFATIGLLAVLGAGYATRVTRERLEAARQPAVIHLDIKPAGDVYVDGQLQGTTPPMLDVKVPPGPHVVEVRSGRFPPLRLDVQLQPGEELQVRHVFYAPPPPRRPRHKERDPATMIEQLKDRIRRLL